MGFEYHTTDHDTLDDLREDLRLLELADTQLLLGDGDYASPTEQPTQETTDADEIPW